MRKPWKVHDDLSGPVHVWPLGDWILHDTRTRQLVVVVRR